MIQLVRRARRGAPPSSLQRAASSISVAHRAAGFASPARSPAVALVLAGIRRTHGTAASRKAPLVVDELLLLVAQLGDDAAVCAIVLCCSSASRPRCDARRSRR